MMSKTLFSYKEEAATANGQFPLGMCPLRSVSATPAELIGFTLVCVLIPTRSGVLRICSVPGPAVSSGADTQHFYFWWMPEHDTAIQPNLAPSRQEVKHGSTKQNNNWLLFKIKHSVLTPAHKSQKSFFC